MRTNQVPHYDMSVNTTGCCPKFNPEGWDGQDLHFKNKPFVRAVTRSVLHVPVDMGQVFPRVMGHMEEAGLDDENNTLVLSRDLSSWRAEHLFAADEPVAGEEMTTLSGEFVTKVFEGPYRKASDWYEQLKAIVAERGKAPGEVWFFYTTCPKCAKAYGKNYVVGVAELR